MINVSQEYIDLMQNTYRPPLYMDVMFAYIDNGVTKQYIIPRWQLADVEFEQYADPMSIENTYNKCSIKQFLPPDNTERAEIIAIYEKLKAGSTVLIEVSQDLRFANTWEDVNNEYHYWQNLYNQENNTWADIFSERPQENVWLPKLVILDNYTMEDDRYIEVIAYDIAEAHNTEAEFFAFLNSARLNSANLPSGQVNWHITDIINQLLGGNNADDPQQLNFGMASGTNKSICTQAAASCNGFITMNSLAGLPVYAKTWSDTPFSVSANILYSRIKRERLSEAGKYVYYKHKTQPDFAYPEEIDVKTYYDGGVYKIAVDYDTNSTCLGAYDESHCWRYIGSQVVHVGLTNIDENIEGTNMTATTDLGSSADLVLAVHKFKSEIKKKVEINIQSSNSDLVYEEENTMVDEQSMVNRVARISELYGSNAEKIEFEMAGNIALQPIDVINFDNDSALYVIVGVTQSYAGALRTKIKALRWEPAQQGA